MAHLLPGGTHVLFALQRESGSDIALLDPADTTRRFGLSGGTMPRYLPTGHLA